MIKFTDYLDVNKPVLGDGAMGTMLFKLGFDPHDCPESVNLSRPEILEKIASEYLAAGAEIIQTNTFGASPLKLKPYGLSEQYAEINKAAVAAVKKVVGDRAFVSGSVGPSGRILVPYGNTLPEEIYDSYQEQVKVLIECGVDIICVETMIDINEAILPIQAVKSISLEVPVIATMTFDSGPKGFYTVMGASVEMACLELRKHGANIVGSNCGHGIDDMIKIAKEFKAYSNAPVMIQSNAGLPQLRDGEPVYPESPQFMAERIDALIDAGVAIIGGCCGTTPEHIAAFRKVIDLKKSG